MNLTNIRYIFTLKDEVMLHNHLYAITVDNDVLHAKKYSKIEDAEPEFLFKLNESLDFEKHHTKVSPHRTSKCTMYKVCSENLTELYTVDMYQHNTPAVDKVLSMKIFRRLTEQGIRGYVNWSIARQNIKYIHIDYKRR